VIDTLKIGLVHGLTVRQHWRLFSITAEELELFWEKAICHKWVVCAYSDKTYKNQVSVPVCVISCLQEKWLDFDCLVGPAYRARRAILFWCCFLFCIFNDICQTSYLKIDRTDIRQICTVGRTYIEIAFPSLQGRCRGNKFLLGLSIELSSSDIRWMAFAYGKKCNWFAGRRQLVAQPGALNVGLFLVSEVTTLWRYVYLFIVIILPQVVNIPGVKNYKS